MVYTLSRTKVILSKEKERKRRKGIEREGGDMFSSNCWGVGERGTKETCDPSCRVIHFCQRVRKKRKKGRRKENVGGSGSLLRGENRGARGKKEENTTDLCNTWLGKSTGGREERGGEGKRNRPAVPNGFAIALQKKGGREERKKGKQMVARCIESEKLQLKKGGPVERKKKRKLRHLLALLLF